MTRKTAPIAIILAAYALCGCVFARPAGDGRFSYTPPEHIAEAHRSECKTRASRAASDAIVEIADEAETVALFTGGLGAWLALEYAAAAEDRAYEETFKDCLRTLDYETGE